MSLRPLLRPLLSPLLRPLLDGVAAVQRIFITLDSAQEGHFLPQNPVTLISGEKFSFNFVSSASGTLSSNEILIAGSAATTNTNYINFNSNNSVGVTDGTATIDGVDTAGIDLFALLDGRQHTLVYTATSTVTIDLIGIARAGTGNSFDGIISDFSNGNAWKLDRATGNTEPAAGGGNDITYVNIPEGAPDRELFTLNTSTTPNQWENADKSRIIEIA